MNGIALSDTYERS